MDWEEARVTRKILVIAGTRPEAVKMAPVVWALHEHPDFVPILCSTGQQREILRGAFDDMGLVPDIEFDVMEPDQGLNSIVSKISMALDEVLAGIRPSAVLVQGDTTTAMTSGLVSFNRKIPVGHVEAGLRTGNLLLPFPEEMNRKVLSAIATWHFAPTQRAIDNLGREGIDPSNTFVTGNTVVDAMNSVKSKLKSGESYLSGTVQEFLQNADSVVLITCHRRESHGARLLSILDAVTEIASKHRGIRFIFPVHPNPNVQEPVFHALKDLQNVLLVEPVSYLAMMEILSKSSIVMTDSGGIQEEAPSFGVPVLVLRDETERPEGVEVGIAKLVGANTSAITSAFEFYASKIYEKAWNRDFINPYGDGRSGPRIVEILSRVTT